MVISAELSGEFSQDIQIAPKKANYIMFDKHLTSDMVDTQM